LSSLTLGLAIDFAIHFLSRIRIAYYTHHLSENPWERTVAEIFQEPARAISRNIIVIACGFLPLLAAPLVPYQTVGFLLASILVFSGVATLVIIPALMRYVNRWFF
ncbi:MAG: RND transporter, partial [Deltaproteobacteria bacterium]